MNNNIPKISTHVILSTILSQLSECHVLGKDSLKFGNALVALEQIIIEEKSSTKEKLKNE